MTTGFCSARLNCCLCDEVSTGRFPAEYERVYEVGSRICRQSDNFLALPSISPLCAGHTLVVPRSHVTSLAALPALELEALSIFSASIAGDLEARFRSKIYFFEHGAGDRGTSCGVDHAHLHVLPLSPKAGEALESRVALDFPSTGTGSLVDILSASAKTDADPYLLHGFDLGLLKIRFDGRIPSQYMRRLLAENNGYAQWDWRLLNGWGAFRATVDALK